jgi:Mce-associated membrane protein
MALEVEGWYVNPQDNDPTVETWWNGHQWTAHTRRVEGAEGTAPPHTAYSTPTSLGMPDTRTVKPSRRRREAPDPAIRVQISPCDASAARPAVGGLLGSLRTTLVLVVALVLLAGVAAGESWYLWFRHEPVVSAARPVVTGEMAHRAAVEAATQDTEEILSTSYKNYDEQVEQATSRMTAAFAAQYRQTIGDIKDAFVAQKTELQVKVVGAGVVRASSEQVQALLFLNQYVSKPGKDTTFTPYRALVTMVHTDHGWLVSQIDTK